MSSCGEQTAETVEGATRSAVSKAADALFSLRGPDGSWLSPVSTDATPLADFFLLQLWLHPPQNGIWKPAGVVDQIARSILRYQLPDGGFSLYPGGPAALDPTIKAFTALKLAGIAENDSAIVRARQTILRLGGLHAADEACRQLLSFFGLYPREFCTPLPPEEFLSSGSQDGDFLALSILYGLKANRPVPAGFHLNDLIADEPRRSEAQGAGQKFARWWDRHAIGAIRRKAVRTASEKMLQQPCVTWTSAIYRLMALDALGYPEGDPHRLAADKHLNSLIATAENNTVIRPCFSPVWDTAAASISLGECGNVRHLRNTGDWLLRNLHASPEPFDHTARALLALYSTGATDSHALSSGAERAIGSLLQNQHKTGGWGHSAGPPSPDVTASSLEALCRHGLASSHPAITRALGYLLQSQEQDGSWYSQTGVNYVYGTFSVLRALRAAGVSDREAVVLRAGEWLRSIQNADGGWGESCASYHDKEFVPAESTASQTAWALLGLLAGGDETSLSVGKGIEYLLNTQRPDGTWRESAATLCLVPGGSYLNHPLIGISYPLLALAGFLKTRREVSQG